MVVPVYNVRPYLVEALDSVLAQTYRNLEVIVVDDGSTDGSGEVCDDFAERDSRFRVIHQENRGLSMARNVGLDVATGEAIAFLDSDDAYRPTFIECLASSMACVDADVVICEAVAKPGMVLQWSHVKERD